MRELTIVYLALTVIMIGGCTSSQALYPANPAHFEQISPDEEFQVEMINGSKFKASSVLVEGDSLHLYAAAGRSRMLTVHRSEVLQLSQRKVDNGRTTMLVVGVAILSALAIGVSLAFKDYDPWEGEEWCLPPQCQSSLAGQKSIGLKAGLSL